MPSYEIQTMRGGRWTTASILDKEEQAMSSAQRHFQDRKCEGVRILSVLDRTDGSSHEKEIFIRTRNVQEEETVSVAQVDKVPPACVTAEEYYGFDSRLTMNRLFRSYCDQVFLTPTELIYDSKELKRLQDKGALVSTAVDRVASLQTRTTNGDPKKRKAEIFKAVEDMMFRSRAAEKLSLPPLEVGKFGELIKKLPSEDKAEYLAIKVLTKSLLDIRNWPGKLEKLCKLALAEPDPKALEMLDGVIADVLGSNIVQDILGWQPNLGQAICRMIDLAEGKLPEQPNDAGESSGLLNSLFGMNKLPISKKCMVERAHRQLRSPNPLNRAQPDNEQETYRQVVERLLLPRGFYDGPETAEALTLRFSRMLTIGGVEGQKKAISGTCRSMPDKVAGIIYLCEMLKLPGTKEHIDAVTERFEDILFVRHISDLCIKGLSGRERLMRATGCYYAVKDAPIPETLKKKVC